MRLPIKAQIRKTYTSAFT